MKTIYQIIKTPMKNLFILIAFTLFLSSCENNGDLTTEDVISSGDLDKIRTKRSSLESGYNELSEQIKLLDEAIHELDTTSKLPLVTTLTIEKQNFTHFVELQGSVKTNENIIIYPEISGILKKITVKEGQEVNKGQLLAIIDDGGMEQQVSQMEIQIDLSKTTFERQERLWNQKIGSEMEYLQSKSSYEAQKKALEQMKIQLSKTRIIAPFSGVIDDIITDEGSLVSPGQSPLIRIVNLKNMYIEADVPESYVNDIVKNKKVDVEFPALGKRMETKVRQAGNFINPANRTFKVEIEVPNTEKHIKPNLTARLRINDYSSENAILIPQSLITENAEGQQYIYVVKNKNEKNEASSAKVFITTGKTQGDFIEVLSGLESGNEIIKEGARSVREGQLVKILEQ